MDRTSDTCPRPGAYVEYTLNVAVAGTYTLNMNVASPYFSAFTVTDNGHKIASVTADTGGWDNITTISDTVTLNAGVQRIRFTSAQAHAIQLQRF